MDKITYDMLEEFGSVVKGVFRLLYPNGLTLEELENKSKEFTWLRPIYERHKGA